MSFNKVNTDGSLTRVAGGTLYADAPIGTIQAYCGTTAPSGWFLCRGQAVSRTTYAELFKVIGTVFGAGDGSTTFNLPDLQNRTIMGAGSNGSLYTVQEDATAKNGLTTFSSQGEGKTGGAGTHTHEVLAYTGEKANIANIYPRSIIASNMETNLGSYVLNADFGGTAVQYLKSDGLHTHYVGLSNGDPETRPKNIRMNWIIKAAQVGVPADFAPVDTIESGNMKAVTSNAVAEAIEAKLFTGSATKSAYVTAGDITWQWTGRICRVLFEGVKIAANTPFLSDICTGLPPSNGTEFLTVCAEYPTTTAAGFLRADRNIGKLLADASVGGQTVEVTLYASVSYITSEDAHQI